MKYAQKTCIPSFQPGEKCPSSSFSGTFIGTWAQILVMALVMGIVLLWNGLVPVLQTICRGFTWCTGLELALIHIFCGKGYFQNLSGLESCADILFMDQVLKETGFLAQTTHSWDVKCSKHYGHNLVNTVQCSWLSFCTALAPVPSLYCTP